MIYNYYKTMGIFDSIAHGFESAWDTVEHGAEEVWSGIGNVTEHVERNIGVVLEHAEHDVTGVVNWTGDRVQQAEQAGIGALNSMEMLPYVAAGLVVFLVLNSNKSAQVIESGAHAASSFR